MKTVAFVPIKLNSQRLPHKNILELAGHPLCWHICNTLNNVSSIDEVYCYCSDEEIKKYIPEGINFLKRPKELDGDCVKGLEIYKGFVKEVDADIYVLAHATSPFIREESVRKSLDAVVNDGYDSAFSAKREQTFSWYKNEPINYQISDIPRTQDIEPVWIETSGFYIFKKEVLEKAKTRIGDNPYIHEVFGAEALDIDERKDFEFARILVKQEEKDVNKKRLMLIAGPCVIESDEMSYTVVERVKDIADRLNLEYYFKASFDKANRTSGSSYRGPGIKKGVEILRNVKEKYGVRICTDIHEPWQAEIVADVAEIIQIPAFLCRQTDLLVAAARTGKTINVKKAQFLAPWDMKNVVKKIEEAGNNSILLCERGTAFGYNRLVVDMTSICEMKKLGYPVVFDATHSVQRPGGNGDSTGGNREFVEPLAKAAIAAGADALFFEVHPNPDKALSDGPNMVRLDLFEEMLRRILEVYSCI